MSSPVPSLKLKANAKSRVLTGHPWVFANEVDALLPAANDGGVVECRDRAGRFLGSGIYNSKSQIIWRRLSTQRVTLDESYLRTALTKALARRDTAARHLASAIDHVAGDYMGEHWLASFALLALRPTP